MWRFILSIGRFRKLVTDFVGKVGLLIYCNHNPISLKINFKIGV